MKTTFSGRFDFYIGHTHIGTSDNTLTPAGLTRLWTHPTVEFAKAVRTYDKDGALIGTAAFEAAPFFAASLGQFQHFGSRVAWRARYTLGAVNGQQIARAEIITDSTVLAVAPTSTLKVEADEVLTVVYSLSIFPPLSSRVMTMQVNGQTHNVIVRPSKLGQVQRKGFRQMFAEGSPKAVVGAAFNAASTAVLDGAVVSDITVTFGDLQVTGDSMRAEITLRIPDSQEPLTFNGIRFDTPDSFNYQIVIDPPITKRDVDSARLRMALTWGNSDKRGHA